MNDKNKNVPVPFWGPELEMGPASSDTRQARPITPGEAEQEREPYEMTPYQQAEANASALEQLRIEIAGKPLDEAEVRAAVDAQNAGRKWNDPEQDADEVLLRRRRPWAAAANWSDLDRLAMTRAAIWIAHADGYGHGVTLDELSEILERKTPTTIHVVARAIVLRMSKLVAAPDADGIALARSDALAGVIPEDNQPFA